MLDDVMNAVAIGLFVGTLCFWLLTLGHGAWKRLWARVKTDRDQPTGVWECPKCGFELHDKVLSLATGQIGYTRDGKRRVCPNDGVDMVVVPSEELNRRADECRVVCAKEGHRVTFGRCMCGKVHDAEACELCQPLRADPDSDAKTSCSCENACLRCHP